MLWEIDWGLVTELPKDVDKGTLLSAPSRYRPKFFISCRIMNAGNLPEPRIRREVNFSPKIVAIDRITSGGDFIFTSKRS